MPSQKVYKAKHQNRYYSDGSSVVTLINDDTLMGEHDYLIPKHSPTVTDSSIKSKIIIGVVALGIGLLIGFSIGLFIMPPGENPDAWQRQRLAFQDDRRQWELQEANWAQAREHYQQDRDDWDIQRASYAQDRMDWQLERDTMREERSRFEAEVEGWKNQREKWASQRDQWQREKRRHDGSYPEPAPGTFWSEPEISPTCSSYGKREYTARIWNVPSGWSWEDACNVLPNEFHGITIMSPDFCENRGRWGMWGHWIVDGEVECQPLLKDFNNDLGCVARGSRTRRVEAEITGFREEDDWQLMCGTTPAIIYGIHYPEPSHCEAGWFGKKYAIWDIPDYSC